MTAARRSTSRAVLSEAAFESHIANSLTRDGGYQEAKVGNVGDEPRDFVPSWVWWHDAMAIDPPLPPEVARRRLR